jgi:hypothetical protein
MSRQRLLKIKAVAHPSTDSYLVGRMMSDPKEIPSGSVQGEKAPGLSGSRHAALGNPSPTALSPLLQLAYLEVFAGLLRVSR